MTAADAQPNDGFGRQACVSGNVIAVGAWKDDDRAEDSGSVYRAPDAGAKDLLGWAGSAYLCAFDL